MSENHPEFTSEELAEMEREAKIEREERRIALRDSLRLSEEEEEAPPFIDDYQDNWLDDCRFGMVGE
jgi:hypothetical protein